MLRARSLISRGWMVHGFGLTDTVNATIMNFETLKQSLTDEIKFANKEAQ